MGDEGVVVASWEKREIVGGGALVLKWVSDGNERERESSWAVDVWRKTNSKDRGEEWRGGICQDEDRVCFASEWRLDRRVSGPKTETRTDHLYTRRPATAYKYRLEERTTGRWVLGVCQCLPDNPSIPYQFSNPSTHLRRRTSRGIPHPDRAFSHQESRQIITSRDSRQFFISDKGRRYKKAEERRRDGARFFRKTDENWKRLERIIQRKLPSTKQFAKLIRAEASSDSDNLRSRSATDDRQRCTHNRRHPA